MKRLWLILLSLGLITAFSTSALAVDVKFSGEYYVAGLYLDKTNLRKDSGSDGISTAFYYQRLRVRTDFVISPGLTLITRFDAMERAWGATRSVPDTTQATNSPDTYAEKENIAFEWAYIEYASPIGIFRVGLMEDGRTGTVFGDSYSTLGRIKYALPICPFFSLNFDITKGKDTSYTAKNTAATWTDADQDKYGLEGVYQWNAGKAGMKVTYYRYADTEPAFNYKKTYFLFTPYAIAKIGPLDIQAELNYATGKLKQFDNASAGSDVTLSNIAGWIDATATFGPVYFGGSFAYASGDDPTTSDKQEGGTLNGGMDWNPCLIMFNFYDRTYWVGSLDGNGTSTNSGPMSNAWFVQGRGGVRPTADLDIMASISYATADQKPTGFNSGVYGTEIDITGTYKITNNLSYMLGVGYWFVGDYFKGNLPNSTTRDDYMVINKLTLKF
jgi:hypothetical protein